MSPKLRTLAVYASGTDVVVEEADLSSADSEAYVSAPNAADTGGESSVVPETSPIKSQCSRPSRKSDMPPVKNGELIAGATFTGKVRPIQPFGAFTDESPDENDKSRPPRRMSQNSNQRRDEPKKFSKFVKGQDMEGTVKNLTRAGAFISLPEAEEGFLAQSEENDGGFGRIMGVTLEVGQEVSVRVLSLSRGQMIEKVRGNKLRKRRKSQTMQMTWFVVKALNRTGNLFHLNSERRIYIIVVFILLCWNAAAVFTSSCEAVAGEETEAGMM
ncbi:hypothetical protein SASPL_123758 [Salvia splendens]|uniref:S1 motif domain-containing protein n=1 Tax=Salvia splendens TaxID=180675 RepID=A0A8X8XQG1_SALSN|nr:hypothetical protein SASPL_123758 [Salvia splendens]